MSGVADWQFLRMLDNGVDTNALFQQAAEKQMQVLEEQTAKVIFNLTEKQQAVEMQVQPLLQHLSNFPVLAPEMNALEMVSKRLEEVQAVQQMLKQETARRTRKAQEISATVSHATQELADVRQFCKKMPHKAAYYEDAIAELGQVIVHKIGDQ